MPEPQKLEKAFLVALDSSGQEDGSTRLEVQFNPENLKVAFANQIAQPQGGGNQSGTDGQQFVGAGTTKLTLQLWFDVTVLTPGEGEPVNDVRRLTAKVARFITPTQDSSDRNKFVPPKVRFGWGSFQFDGLMESMDESLEFFSNDGRPLRANVSLSLSQQKIAEFVFRPASGPGAAPPGTQSPGQQPMTAAPSGGSVQQLAAANGKVADWKKIAAANQIENPRLLGAGTLIDLNANSARATFVPPSVQVTPPAPPRFGLRR